MKLSLKLQDDQQQHKNLNPLITAKIPISILNHPFLTSVSTNSLSSDLSFSLSSNFSSGPSLKLSYSPTSATTPPSFLPFSLSLKSGLGLFGSPDRSPLVFKAHFSFSSQNPTFSLHFNPQFGNFALKKTAFSNPRTGFVSVPGSKHEIGLDSGSGSGSNAETGNGFSPEGSSVWQDVKLEPCGNGNGNGNGGGFDDGVEGFLGSKVAEKRGVLTGIAVMARTVFPVSKRLVVNVRWGVNLPSDLGAKMPYLTMNKIGIERVENENDSEAREERNKRIGGGGGGDLELLKGLCFWMSRDLEAIGRENREMKRSLEEMRKLRAFPGKPSPRPNSAAVKAPSGESLGEFERWNSKKSVKEENVKREAKKPGDLESELQRAIKAAAAGSSA